MSDPHTRWNNRRDAGFRIGGEPDADVRQRSHRFQDLEESLPDPSPSLQARTEHKAELEAVMAALQQLAEVDRAALLMRVQEEMPYEEIAQALDLPVTTVKVKVHRARLKLMRAREVFQEVRS